MTVQKKLEEIFIENIIKIKTPVSIYLVNGVQLKGYIERNDEKTLILKNDLPQIIFKHAISTIVPSEVVAFD